VISSTIHYLVDEYGGAHFFLLIERISTEIFAFVCLRQHGVGIFVYHDNAATSILREQERSLRLMN
jgi:hypothetical protein